MREARRVVVTGMGVVSCLGNTLVSFATALRESRSGLSRIEAWRSLGLPSQVAGRASVALSPSLDRKLLRFVGDTGRFACHAARAAIDDAGLDAARLRARDVGAVVGSGVGAVSAYDEAMALVAARGIEKVGPYVVPRVMSSTCSAALAYAHGMQGIVYSPSAACCTSAIAIGQAMQLIQSGAQTIVLAGGSEELHTGTALMFGAMGVLATASNENSLAASRPYDEARDGFVMASGAGVLVLEERSHALARGARIHAEVTGFGHVTEGGEMIGPGRGSIAAAIRDALGNGGAPDYVNTHAPSTPLGDIEELHALVDVFGGAPPPFSSIKGLCGHALGASGALDAIATLSMMRGGFMAGTPNLATRVPLAHNLPLVEQVRDARIREALSVSFGFGGVAACIAFRAADSV
ncbi:beta-ketoacyl synthase N-terminal-like domain-containing protein [Caballeronia sp. LZ001]|uniref:beta-ketoacyl-[acyl-carrier-protein] synthase family protein n=1 Tax=Caballeronia sp. LZ001 TaxID=3038553 RepID=UPI00285B7407|nr:beta-ketoacyl synthase N-terminal-like domain-containing protein [Caballeronia sp. LZ001]MDR5801401.1 beta-ketoacyl synthase N-terminal-like domain-containing protein [Caballeronia sp. LZ001]